MKRRGREQECIWARGPGLCGAAIGIVAGLTAAAAAQCDQWQPLGDGVNSEVDSLVMYDGDLIAGGFFWMAGGQSAERIARWDGTSWSPLGAGMGPLVVSTAVLALAIYDGDLIAGGQFTSAGGQSANRIARWDGASWAPLDTGMTRGIQPASVAALTVHDGDLIAGGLFSHAGGQSANNIARWDGGFWTSLGPGLASGADRVLALTTFNGELIAGGGFRFSGAQAINRIARWDGNLIAGGSFTEAGGQSVDSIASWDGSSWSPLGSGVTLGSIVARVDALTVYNGVLIAGGTFTHAGGQSADNIASWDGVSWETVGAGVDLSVQAVAAIGKTLVSGGQFQSAGGQSASRIAAWEACVQPCYADCNVDGVLNISDFLCFIDEFAHAQTLPAAEQITHYANCDGSTAEPVLTIGDFLCFIDEFAQGCP